MRIPRVVHYLLAGCACLLAVSTLQAQRAAAPPAPAAVVLDMSVLSEKSNRLKQQVETIKVDVEAIKAKLKKDSDYGNEMAAKLQKMAPDDPNRKKLESDLMKMKADFELKGKRSNEDIREQETKMMFNFSREVGAELENFGKSNNIQLILRKDLSSLDTSDPRAILQEIQKNVVYNRGNDVTNVVVDSLNRRTPAANTAKAPTPPTNRK